MSKRGYLFQVKTFSQTKDMFDELSRLYSERLGSKMARNQTFEIMLKQALEDEKKLHKDY